MLVDRLGNSALSTAQSVGEDHGLLAALAHRIHEQSVVLTSADLYRVMGCIAIALLLLVPVLPTRIYPPWCTTPPSSR
jgi:DHA2 family multidrug resistance protein